MLSEFKKDGVERIEAVFEGRGDSGGLEDLKLFPEGKGYRQRVADWLEEHIINKVHFDWYNNDGGRVEIVIDVCSREMTTTCYEYVMQENKVSETTVKL